jgi:aspartate aminotransferase-like enzyme
MRIARFMKWPIWSAVLLTSVAWPHAQGTRPAPSAPSQQTASQFYLEYRAAFDRAKKLEDILPFMTARKRTDAEAMPAIVRDMGLESMKATKTVTTVKNHQGRDDRRRRHAHG